MKFEKLKSIIVQEAEQRKKIAAYSGAWDDGGCQSLLNRLSEFKNQLIVKYDLRPSEYYKLNDVEVGEPYEFSSEIEKFKIKLAKNIEL